MNPTLAAAAWLLLSGGPPPVAIPLPTMPQPPVLDCQLPPPPGARSHHQQNHLTIRWASPRQYYDRGHRRRHHPRHEREHFEDQG